MGLLESLAGIYKRVPVAMNYSSSRFFHLLHQHFHLEGFADVPYQVVIATGSHDRVKDQ
jgi:hypothetical protein